MAKKKNEILEIKKPNPNVRNSIVQTRLNAAELKVVHEKAFVHCKGDMSKFIRIAVLNYKPITKKAV